jgi:hypothetical protein
VTKTEPIGRGMLHARDVRNGYKILVGKREAKMPLGRYIHRWEDNIKVGNTVIG